MAVHAVVGGTGTIGSRVVQRLAAQGEEVRSIARAAGPGGNRVTPVGADLTDPAQAREALGPATRVYVTPPLGGADPLANETAVVRTVIDAAVASGVEHVVLHTAVRSDRGDTGARILDNKTPLEHALEDSGLGFTILRPAWFFQNLWLARDHLLQGVVSMPWPGDMVWAATDVEDVVDATVALFARGPANRAFDLHAPGGITGQGLADATARVLGRDVTYQQAPVPARQFTDSFPISDVHKDLYAELFDYFMSTTYLGDVEPIEKELEMAPHTPERFLREELFADR